MEGFVNHTEALRWVGKPCECVKRYGATDEVEIISELTIEETNFGRHPSPRASSGQKMNEQLLFVYNADSGLFSVVADFAHKILSPKTYACHLCALTYGDFSMKQEWKKFIECLPVKAEFLHKDAFEKRYGTAVELPAVFVATSGGVKGLISRAEIESCQSLHELETMVTERLKAHVQHHHTNI